MTDQAQSLRDRIIEQRAEFERIAAYCDRLAANTGDVRASARALTWREAAASLAFELRATEADAAPAADASALAAELAALRKHLDDTVGCYERAAEIADEMLGDPSRTPDPWEARAEAMREAARVLRDGPEARVVTSPRAAAVPDAERLPDGWTWGLRGDGYDVARGPDDDAVWVDGGTVDCDAAPLSVVRAVIARHDRLAHEGQTAEAIELAEPAEVARAGHDGVLAAVQAAVVEEATFDVSSPGQRDGLARLVEAYARLVEAGAP